MKKIHTTHEYLFTLKLALIYRNYFFIAMLIKDGHVSIEEKGTHAVLIEPYMYNAISKEVIGLKHVRIKADLSENYQHERLKGNSKPKANLYVHPDNWELFSDFLEAGNIKKMAEMLFFDKVSVDFSGDYFISIAIDSDLYEEILDLAGEKSIDVIKNQNLFDSSRIFDAFVNGMENAGLAFGGEKSAKLDDGEKVINQMPLPKFKDPDLYGCDGEPHSLFFLKEIRLPHLEEKEQYERCAKVRNQIKKLEQINQNQNQ